MRLERIGMLLQSRGWIVLMVVVAMLLLAFGAVRLVSISGEPVLTMTFSLTATEDRRLGTAETGLYTFVTAAVRFPLPRVVRLEAVDLDDQSGQYDLVDAWVVEAGFNGEAEDLEGTGLAELATPVTAYRPQSEEVWLLLQLINKGGGPDSSTLAGPFTLHLRYALLGIPLTREFSWGSSD